MSPILTNEDKEIMIQMSNGHKTSFLDRQRLAWLDSSVWAQLAQKNQFVQFPLQDRFYVTCSLIAMANHAAEKEKKEIVNLLGSEGLRCDLFAMAYYIISCRDLIFRVGMYEELVNYLDILADESWDLSSSDGKRRVVEDMINSFADRDPDVLHMCLTMLDKAADKQKNPTWTRTRI